MLLLILHTTIRPLAILLTLCTSVLAQLPLPSPPFLPPDSSSGAQPSSGGYPNQQWTTLLGNLLYFYEAQRSGELPSSNRVPWRNSSALDDGIDAHIDLSGGYYDAGDYSKDTFPLSFTLMSICWGANDFGKGYDLANQTAYLDDMLRWGLDWLIKAHPNDTTLYVLVASKDTADGTYWGGDRSIPSPRPVYQINDSQPGTDAAAGAAAAFAACSNLYADRALDNGTYSAPAKLRNDSYSSTLLTHAQQLYAFAVNATGGRKTYQTSVPQVAASYQSSGYGDELAIAALFLSWATGSASLYQEAEAYYSKYKLGDTNRVFNWDSKTPGLAVLFCQIAQSFSASSGNFSEWQAVAETYFDSIVNNQGPGSLTKDGLLFFQGDSNLASLNPALNTAMLLHRFSPIASTTAKKAAYLDFANRQVNYTLGKNSMSVPYIVGINPNSPSNPHSAMASGGQDITQIDTSPAQEAYVLYGAVVGGPDDRGRFFDIRSDWPQTEVALDYNAPMLTLAAMHVLADTNDPYYTSLKAGAYDKVKPQGFPCDPVFSQGCQGPHLSKSGLIAMALVITVVGLIILGLAVYYLVLLMRTAPT
ncbi:glycoside hydrolase family 9 protein [Laccaria amethystina LaAM-08-1]|uniref:Endoglucanase n=1 Tax=Laccaria amethystina LaAM-08-1 TaxID=1095629 RepID=A0A0C9XTU8_9AGAR|nr:glycoside hydrolase family 9 protein [Laccaria amethystina LaAM-08-1]